jgi:2-polyprenyl-3-methyl-5-hydroxy-6-metoxy-1,4-benzoquinol methylase
MSNAAHSGVAEHATASHIVQTRANMKKLAKKVLNKDTRVLLRRLTYAGTKYYCNVCGNRARRMFTTGYPFPVLAELDVVGGEEIPYDTCPICFSNGRARLLFEYVRREIGIYNLQSQIRVLHVAPEYGILCRLKASKMIDYVGVDLVPDNYRGTAEITACDVTAIDYRDESFDLIICSHVLEHIPDDRLAIKELFRVLKPGGRAILQVPISASLPRTIEDPNLTDPKERERRFGQHDHVRIYGADYPVRLGEAGFLVEIFDPASHWGTIGDLRLNPRERVFVGRK